MKISNLEKCFLSLVPYKLNSFLTQHNVSQLPLNDELKGLRSSRNRFYCSVALLAASVALRIFAEIQMSQLLIPLIAFSVLAVTYSAWNLFHYARTFFNKLDAKKLST